MIDTMTSEGAKGLANIITEYWRSRGFQPEVKIIETFVYTKGSTTSQNTVYIVRSNLINGIPQSLKKSRAA